MRLVKLLTLAGVFSCLFFFLANDLGEMVIDRYYLSSDYEERTNRKYVSELQSFIEKNQVEAGDYRELNAWVTKQKILFLEVYRNDVLLFDSAYPELEESKQEMEYNYYSYKKYYTVTFADGEAQIAISGLYSYQLYSWALAAELMVSFLLFVVIVLLGIRRTIRYIRTLSEEIQILEGGDLDYEITVSGRDELALLAKNLDDMRKSFRNKVEQEAHLVRSNRRMITEMSHDLRTPLTSIMLYTEILQKQKFENREQMQNYVDKIAEKSRWMKQMSDHLFEYALVTGKGNVELEEPASFEFVLYDLLSETCAWLEQNGFESAMELDWDEGKVQVNTDYMIRIIDNLTSNILKYADRAHPVTIRGFGTDKTEELCFENHRTASRKKEESTGIGLENVKNMMTSMNGECHVKEYGDRFCITLVFPKYGFRIV